MEVRAFSKSYDKNPVLQFPAFSFEKGSVYAVIGANGSGKSTFARILAGVLPGDQKSSPFVSACKVGYMPQKSYGFRMRVEKNILLGGKDRQRAQALMEKLDITHLASRRADRLSGGETARMALVRTLMRGYDLVLLDEPTAAMDIASAALAEDCILDYQRETGGVTLIVTHSLKQARRLGDQVLFFHQGNLLEWGPSAQVLEQPEQEETRRFLEFYGA